MYQTIKIFLLFFSVISIPRCFITLAEADPSKCGTADDADFLREYVMANKFEVEEITTIFTEDLDFSDIKYITEQMILLSYIVYIKWRLHVHIKQRDMSRDKNMREIYVQPLIHVSPIIMSGYYVMLVKELDSPRCSYLPEKFCDAPATKVTCNVYHYYN